MTVYQIVEANMWAKVRGAKRHSKPTLRYSCRPVNAKSGPRTDSGGRPGGDISLEAI